MPVITATPQPYAEVADVEDRWRQLSADEADRAVTLLADASLVVDAAYPRLAGIAATLGIPPAATMVVANMVRRALVAPAEGYAGDSPAALTPASYSSVGGNLYLLKSERSVLAALTGSRRGRAFSVNLGPE